MKGRLVPVGESYPIRVLPIARRAHDDPHSARRVESVSVGSLHLLERDDLRADRVDQVRTCVDA
jgi:hypothetical protein